MAVGQLRGVCQRQSGASERAAADAGVRADVGGGQPPIARGPGRLLTVAGGWRRQR
jgi:hypothetical protein